MIVLFSNYEVFDIRPPSSGRYSTSSTGAPSTTRTTTRSTTMACSSWPTACGIVTAPSYSRATPSCLTLTAATWWSAPGVCLWWWWSPATPVTLSPSWPNWPSQITCHIVQVKLDSVNTKTQGALPRLIACTYFIIILSKDASKPTRGRLALSSNHHNHI